MPMYKKMQFSTNISMKGTESLPVGELYIYDDIMPDERDFWTGQTIESSTDAQRIKKAIDDMGDISALNVYISSAGGDIVTGYAIFSQLQRITAPVTAYIDGVAASMASVIACAGNELVMYPTSMLMIHNAISYAYGNAADMRKTADDLEKISGMAREAYAAKSGGKVSPERFGELMDAETWLSAQECFDLGLCDRVEQLRGSRDTAPKMYSSAVHSMNAFMRGSAEISKLKSEIAELRGRIEKPPDTAVPESAAPTPLAAENIAAILSGLMG